MIKLYIFSGPDKGKSFDVGGRMYVQFHYDFVRWFGLFGRLGVMARTLRWVSMDLDASFGVQARFP